MNIQKSLTVTLAATAIVLSFASLASAQRCGGGRGIDSSAMPLSSARKAKLSFQAVDANRDGEITPAELTAAGLKYPQLNSKEGLIKFYASIDANQDGAIKQAEFTSWLRAQKKTATAGGARTAGG